MTYLLLFHCNSGCKNVSQCCYTYIDFLVFPSYKQMYLSTCTEQIALHNSEVHGSLHNCGCRNLLHVTFLTPRIWRWLPDIWKICGPLHYAFMLRKLGVCWRTLSSAIAVICSSHPEYLYMLHHVSYLITLLSLSYFMLYLFQVWILWKDKPRVIPAGTRANTSRLHIARSVGT